MAKQAAVTMSCLKYCSGLLIVGLCVVGFARHLLQPRRVETPNITDTGWQSATIKISPGVTYHYFAEGSPELRGTHSDALIIDVDLRTKGVRVQLATDSPARSKHGGVYGEAHTVLDWCKLNHAIGGINGGYFGASDGSRKQIEGLLIADSEVLAIGSRIRSTRKVGESYVRCALGFDTFGKPRIGWATASHQPALQIYTSPLSRNISRTVRVSSGVSCGPRLVANSEIHITDRQERLVSEPALPRTFVAYDVASDARHTPVHMVIGIGMELTYADTAQFLMHYFKNMHAAKCAEAMCLDGGASSQLVFATPVGDGNEKRARTLVDTRPSLVTVPTALLVECH